MIGTSREVFRDLFRTLHQNPEPMAMFGNIPHWKSVARSLIPQAFDYENEWVYLPSGCFYGLSTPVPTNSEIREAIDQATRNGATYLMYPCVRHGTDRTIFAENGFLAFPWFIESVYCMKAGIENDLREQLGSPRFRQVRRLLRKHELSYSMEVHVGRECHLSNPWIVSEFDRLHQMNLKKYGHTVNFYNRQVLDRLLDSALAENVLFYFCRDRETGSPVQALLGLIDFDSSRMQLLVHGIDADAVRPGHNIYSSAYFELYQWGSERGIREFQLGRGGQKNKMRMGANTFHLLFNYVKPLGSGIGEIESVFPRLKELAEQRAEQDLLALSGEGFYSLPTSWK